MNWTPVHVEVVSDRSVVSFIMWGMNDNKTDNNSMIFRVLNL